VLPHGHDARSSSAGGRTRARPRAVDARYSDANAHPLPVVGGNAPPLRLSTETYGSAGSTSGAPTARAWGDPGKFRDWCSGDVKAVSRPIRAVVMWGPREIVVWSSSERLSARRPLLSEE